METIKTILLIILGVLVVYLPTIIEKLNKMGYFKKIKKELKSNFKFNAFEPKETSRKKAWKLDSEVLVEKSLIHKNQYMVVGNKSRFVYNDELDNAAAKVYATELNNNRNLSILD